MLGSSYGSYFLGPGISAHYYQNHFSSRPNRHAYVRKNPSSKTQQTCSLGYGVSRWLRHERIVEAAFLVLSSGQFTDEDRVGGSKRNS